MAPNHRGRAKGDGVTGATREFLQERGVRYCFASYVDVHGVMKGKAVPIDHFDRMMRGSELYTGAALDGLGQNGARAGLFGRLTTGDGQTVDVITATELHAKRLRIEQTLGFVRMCVGVVAAGATDGTPLHPNDGANARAVDARSTFNIGHIQ